MKRVAKADANCGLIVVGDDSMSKTWKHVSALVDWAITITTIGLALFLIVGTFTLMLWNGDT